MKISIKSYDDIIKMRMVGQMAAEVLEIIEPYIQPGVSTEDLNDVCHYHITNIQNARPASLGYFGFPKSVCISVNEVVCHGIPSKKKLRKGDIINIDVAITKNGFYSDTSKMYFVGEPTILGKRLCKVAKESLIIAIHKIKPGIRLYKIGKSIQKFVESKNFSIVQEYCGHGIGKKFHEEPQILHYNADDQGIILKPGMAFTIEPMINVGSNKVRVMKDGWTVKTKDRSLSAQYEHTIVVTKYGCEVVTARKNENVSKIIFHPDLK